MSSFNNDLPIPTLAEIAGLIHQLQQDFRHNPKIEY